MTVMRILSLLICIALLGAAERRVRVWVTFYCPGKCCCGRFADGYTSTGKWLHGPFRTSGGTSHYGVAADPRAVPYGSLVIFEGYTVSRYYPTTYAWPVDDTGDDMRDAWRRPSNHPRVRDGTIPNQRFIALDFRCRSHAGAESLARKHGGWQWATIIER
jgi:hypothetical protein